MQNPIFSYYNPNYKPFEHEFYILCKGLNSGKPLDLPCPNSFVCKCNSQQQKDFYYWLIFGLWEVKHFYPFHKGTAIPFITIYDFKKEISRQSRTIEPIKDQFKNTIDKIKFLEEKEKSIRMYLTEIQSLKHAMVRRHLTYSRA
jgi:hypothetical protein